MTRLIVANLLPPIRGSIYSPASRGFAPGCVALALQAKFASPFGIMGIAFLNKL